MCVYVCVCQPIYNSLHHHYYYRLYHVCIFCEIEKKTIRARGFADKLHWLKMQALGQFTYLPASVFLSV